MKWGSEGERPSDEVLYGQQGLMMKGGSGGGKPMLGGAVWTTGIDEEGRVWGGPIQ